MAVLVGRKAPQFSAKAVVKGTSVEADFSLEQYLGKKNVVLFFYLQFMVWLVKIYQYIKILQLKRTLPTQLLKEV